MRLPSIMMNVKKGSDVVLTILPAKEIYLKGNEHAVLLLHSFTSHTRDMKKVATKLHEEGYTCYVPLYRGHGHKPEPLLQYKVEDWWQDVVKAHQFLLNEGYQKISVIGLSIGGIFTLKLAQLEKLERIIVLSVPIDKEPAQLKQRIIDYAYNFKHIEGKSEQQMTHEMEPFNDMPLDAMIGFQRFIKDTMQQLEEITMPIAIFYGKRDEDLYAHSADTIYQRVHSMQKLKRGFENSKHLMTLGREQDEILQEIMQFLE
ncbi:MAG: alpha/beta hydrolase [Lysinibacillus fusiformis]|nr:MULTISPECIES: alpha/beta fold hydrolase [Lysinibacillus]MCK1987787.1 alpha/beta hydrolase [Lysinibacillus fusiformis]MCT6815955.1 alpha/beta hydrolase [Lysinibacillus fusiformis]